MTQNTTKGTRKTWLDYFPKLEEPEMLEEAYDKVVHFKNSTNHPRRWSADLLD